MIPSKGKAMHVIEFIRTLLIVLGAAVCFAAGCSAADALEIVRDGVGQATIVVAANDKDATTGAGELQTFIERMSGAKLPIVAEGEPVEAGGIIIYVGHTEAANAAGVKIPAGFDPTIRPDMYEEEGYVVKTKGRRIFVGGNGDGPYHGTLYGVYALLENLGCRWYFPGDWGEVIPQKKTVTVGVLDVESKPDFAMRNIWIDGRWLISNENRQIHKQWTLRVGFSKHSLNAGIETMYPTPGDGYLAHPLQPKEYAEKHPEWYSMDESGVRDIDPERSSSFAMLCLSNEEMVAEYIKNVGEAFEGKRKIGNVSDLGVGISPPDGAPYCYCEKCKASSENFNYPRYVHKTMQTEEVCRFINKVAAAFPAKQVGVAAYSLRDIAPQGVKLLPNVSVMQAPISCCVIHPNDDPTCWRRQEFIKNLVQWVKLTPHVWVYDYTQGMLVSQFEPERDVTNFSINAPIYKKIGIKGFGRQGSNAMMATWIGYYTSAKLMWDVDADIEELKKDFYNTFFGAEAGPHVQAWWDACEAKQFESRLHVHESWLLVHLYTADFTRSIRKHVEAARQSKMTDQQRERFEIFELIAEHFEKSTQMDEAVKNLDYEKAAARAGRMLEIRTKLNEISEFLIGKSAQTQQWEMFTLGRKLKYEKLAARLNGGSGKLVVTLPLETKFKRDLFNVGITSEWYENDFNDADWGSKNTYLTWDSQDEPEDAVGHDYDGYGWYRFTVDIANEFKGEAISLFCGGAINEAWVWVNGEYVGHREHVIWWMGKNEIDFDVSEFVRPGKNTIAIRIWNDVEIGGMLNRGFLWSPNKVETAPVPTDEK